MLKHFFLTAKMYAAMKQNLFDNERIAALQTELSLRGSGDNEAHNWFTQFDVINSLQQQRRLEEVEQTLPQWNKELKQSGLANNEYNKISTSQSSTF